MARAARYVGRLTMALAMGATATLAGAGTGAAQDTGLTEIQFEGDHTVVTSLTAYQGFIAGERPAQRPIHDYPLNQDRFPPNYAGPTDCYRPDRPVEYGRRCSLSISVINTSDQVATMSVRIEGDVAASDDPVWPADPLRHSDGTNRTQRVDPGATAQFDKLVEHRSTATGTVTLTVLSEFEPIATAAYTFRGTFWVPTVPTNVRLGTRPDSLVLIWDPPVNDGGSPLTGYEVRLLEVNPAYNPTIAEGDKRRWLSDTPGCNFRERPELTTCDVPNNDLTSIAPGIYQFRLQAFNGISPGDLGPYFYGLFFTDPFTVDRTLTQPEPAPPNRAPSLHTATPAVETVVGRPVRVRGSVSDPDGDPVVLTVSAGTLEVDAGTWAWSHPGYPDPGVYTVGVTATDSHGASSRLDLTVTAVAPPPPATTVATAVSVAQLVAASDYDPVSHARVLRLYQAIFGRYPDLAGAKYWIDVNNRGHGVLAIAGYMSVSTEWANTYRGTTDAQFVAAVYTNVLGRDYDLAGYLYWLDLIETGRLTRPQAVYYVTANPEFTRNYPFQP